MFSKGICQINPFYQPDTSHLSTIEKETLFLDKIGVVVSRAAAVLSLYACVTSGSILLTYSAYAAISVIAYKILSSMAVSQNKITTPPSMVKLFAKHISLTIYCKALKIFRSILNKCSVSSTPLNEHHFKMKVLRQYVNAEAAKLSSQKKFQKYLKVSTINLPKLEDALKGSYLESAKKYLLEFSKEYTEEKIQALCKEKSEQICKSESQAVKDDYNQLLIDMEKEKPSIPKEEDLKRPKHGVCAAAVAKIFQKFITAKNSLEEIVGKCKEGFGKKTAGLHSFCGALSDKRLSNPGSPIFQNDPDDYMLEQINIKRTKEKAISHLIPLFKSEDDLLEMIEKVSSLKDGCYYISLTNFEDSDTKGSIVIGGSSHAILLIKQDDCVQIVDPNVGLLVTNEKVEILELIKLVLSYYAKKNKNFNLQANLLLKQEDL